MFASKSTLGFYDVSIHTYMPDDVIEISAEYHAELMAGQSVGKVITWGEDGYPVLIDPPPFEKEQLEAMERSWRNAQMIPTDSLVSRHRDELESGEPTTLTAEQYTELQAYRRQLRNWPQGAEFPLVDHRPVAPGWLTGPLQ
ncbi:tail fiber assembly protein [Pseudomonas nunensis]|uniref:tail fiber assembly protein n=1 Tax=Pseudomonas nunensis TaxID=2961896 RepID=UPI0006B3FAE7|nr:tail fiber assembly protein [Pseudomonas nunensis]KOY02192.1 phage tail protein [Pseudomonas nunensis]